MKRPGRAAVVFAAAALIVAAGADEARKLSIRAVMHKQYTVEKAPLKVIRKEMESESPDWPRVEAAARTFAELGEALAKNQPRRGSQESWERFLARNEADARAILEGAKLRDQATVRAAATRLARACTPCHEAHKFRREE